MCIIMQSEEKLYTPYMKQQEYSLSFLSSVPYIFFRSISLSPFWCVCADYARGSLRHCSLLPSLDSFFFNLSNHPVRFLSHACLFCMCMLTRVRSFSFLPRPRSLSFSTLYPFFLSHFINPQQKSASFLRLFYFYEGVFPLEVPASFAHYIPTNKPFNNDRNRFFLSNNQYLKLPFVCFFTLLILCNYFLFLVFFFSFKGNETESSFSRVTTYNRGRFKLKNCRPPQSSLFLFG